MSDNLPLILITGATGFIGSWTTKKAIECGKYRVRGTTRNPKSKRATKLLELCPGLELVSCELMKDDGWSEAFEGVSLLMHTASPFFSDHTGKFDFVAPALQGTKRVLQFAKAAGVKKIVVTSSNTAVSWSNAPGYKVQPKMYTEEDWTPVPEGATDYDSSKTLAEKAAWEFADENKDISMCVVNPGLVFGRSLLGTAGGTLDFWKMTSTSGMAPRMMIPAAIVEDVAEIHVNALGKLPELHKRRIIVVECQWYLAVCEDTAAKFNPMGYKFPDTQLPGCILCCMFNVCCCCNPLAEVGGMIGVEYSVDNKLAKSLTNNGNFRDLQKACVEMTDDFITSGAMEKKPGYAAREHAARKEK